MNSFNQNVYNNQNKKAYPSAKPRLNSLSLIIIVRNFHAFINVESFLQKSLFARSLLT